MQLNYFKCNYKKGVKNWLKEWHLLLANFCVRFFTFLFNFADISNYVLCKPLMDFQ